MNQQQAKAFVGNTLTQFKQMPDDQAKAIQLNHALKVVFHNFMTNEFTIYNQGRPLVGIDVLWNQDAGKLEYMFVYQGN